MKKIEKITFSKTILMLLLILSIPAYAQNSRGIKLKNHRTALIIGNSAYQTAPLKNPINDAEDITATLKKVGFTVILKKNADQRSMEDIIRYFGKQLRRGGIGLFYFAGHGMQVDGRNYLIPIGAKIESESDVKYEAVDAGRILGKMKDAENQLNIVILDACRNNPFSRNFRSSERGLARMNAPKGSFISYATAPGEVAADGQERNGIFTKYLMKHMLVPNLPIEQVLKRVRIDVANETNGRQIPWESSSLMGDFYFNPERSAINTEIANKSKIPAEIASETQVAATSDVSKRNVEPWTGIWELKYSYGGGYIFVLKQNGKIVKSTGESCCELSGKINGTTFKGWIEFFNERLSCNLNISSNNQSLAGSITAPGWNYQAWSFISGKRINK